MDLPKMIYTGSIFFGQKIFIESTGDKDVDKAIKATFHDNYHKTAPLKIARDDVQLALNWRNKKVETRSSVAEQRIGQMPLF